VDFSTEGYAQLGDATDDAIYINSHIVNSDLVFDENKDTITLTLHFEDPSAPTTITFPDESGQILTTDSRVSSLEASGALSSGNIGEGFGSIVTSGDIRTVGVTSKMVAAGTSTANSNFRALGTSQFGDEAEDDVYFYGVMQRHMTFKTETGLKFRSESGEKETLLLAVFDDDSEAGDRLIMVPDVPMGGAIHITFNGGEAAASNVHQVSIDATAGVIESYSDDLAPGESNVINLVNKRIKTDSIVIATIACDGYRLCEGASTAGGWVLVTAVKVNELNGGATIVVRNLHPTQTMTTTFSINFIVFNSS